MLAFLSEPATVAVPAGKHVLAIANKTFGTYATGGAYGLRISVCARNTYSDDPVEDIIPASTMDNLTLPQFQHQVFGISAVFTPPAEGIYTLGMCGSVGEGNTSWNDNRGSTTTLLVF